MTGPRAERPLLRAALSAAGRGWPVFPLRPGSKRPAITGWPQRATCDPAVLAGWWARAPYNIGIACGPAGLLVVDLDEPRDGGAGPDGREVFAALAAAAGERHPRPTYTVRTPRGEQRYFTVAATPAPANAVTAAARPGPHAAAGRPAASGAMYFGRVRLTGRTTAGVLGRHVDTRGPGGYVVAAGSMVRVDDERRYYRRRGAPGPEPIPAPPWLLEALAPAPRSGSAREPTCAPGRTGAYGTAALRAEASLVRAAGTGTRNACLFGAAVRLGQLAAAGVLDEHQVRTALVRASSVHLGIEGFTDAEAARAIGNGLAYGRRRPRLIRPAPPRSSAE